MLDQNLIEITRDKDEDEHEVNVIVPRLNIPEPIVIAYNGQKPVLYVGVSPRGQHFWYLYKIIY